MCRILIWIPCSGLVELAVIGCPGIGADLGISLSCLVSYRAQPPACLPFFSEPYVALISVLVLRPDAMILISSGEIFLLLAILLMIS